MFGPRGGQPQPPQPGSAVPYPAISGDCTKGITRSKFLKLVLEAFPESHENRVGPLVASAFMKKGISAEAVQQTESSAAASTHENLLPPFLPAKMRENYHEPQVVEVAMNIKVRGHGMKGVRSLRPNPKADRERINHGLEHLEVT